MLSCFSNFNGCIISHFTLQNQQIKTYSVFSEFSHHWAFKLFTSFRISWELFMTDIPPPPPKKKKEILKWYITSSFQIWWPLQTIPPARFTLMISTIQIIIENFGAGFQQCQSNVGCHTVVMFPRGALYMLNHIIILHMHIEQQFDRYTVLKSKMKENTIF